METEKDFAFWMAFCLISLISLLRIETRNLRILIKGKQLGLSEEFIEKQSAKMPGRPIFNKMLARIEKGEARGVPQIQWASIAEAHQKISENENLTIDEEAIEILYDGSEGDCRRSINLLQSTAVISPTITANLISTILAGSKPKDVRIVLDYALSGNFVEAREKLLDIMLKESVSGQDIIKSIQKEIWNLPVEPELKMKLIEKTGETEFRITEGSDTFIQLQSLLASFVLAGQGK